MHPEFRLYFKARVFKTALYWHKNKHVDQQSRIETSDANLHTYDQLLEKNIPPVLLPGKSHGHRSLVGYSSGGHKESDMTKRPHFLSF